MTESVRVTKDGAYAELGGKALQVTKDGAYAELGGNADQVTKAGAYAEIERAFGLVRVSKLGLYAELGGSGATRGSSLVTEFSVYLELEYVQSRVTELGAYVELEPVQTRVSELGAYIELGHPVGLLVTKDGVYAELEPVQTRTTQIGVYVELEHATGLLVTVAGAYAESEAFENRVSKIGAYAELNGQSITVTKDGVYAELGGQVVLVSKDGAYAELGGNIAQITKTGAYLEILIPDKKLYAERALRIYYNDVEITAYLEGITLEASVEIAGTESFLLVSEGTKVPTLPDWAFTAHGYWSAELDALIAPDVITPPVNLRNFRVLFGQHQLVVYDWYASAFVSEYSNTENIDQAIDMQIKFALSGPPVRNAYT